MLRIFLFLAVLLGADPSVFNAVWEGARQSIDPDGKPSGQSLPSEDSGVGIDPLG